MLEKTWKFKNPENLEPTKFVILRIFLTKFGDFCKIWILANLKSLTLKFQNLKSLTLPQKFPIWTQIFCILMIFVTNLKKILPKLTKLVITQNLTKSQNLRSLTLKSKIFIFDKI